MPKLDHDTIELILIAVTAAAVLLQAFVLLGILLGLKKTSRAMLEQIEDLKASITPFIDNSREFLARVGPKVEGTTADIADITRRLKAQAVELETSTAAMHEFVRKQTSRIDEMMSGLLNAVDRAGNYMADTLNKPIRQISGIMSAVRAIVESLHTPAPETHETPTSRDRETFI
jgi:methyl-accepting chemotaxis protein